MKEEAAKKQKMETPVKTEPIMSSRTFVGRKSLPMGTMRPLVGNDRESPMSKLLAKSPTKLKGTML
jgi:hypothetical protein